jgi:hypothetical protein
VGTIRKNYAELEIGLRWRFQINAFEVTLHYSDPSKEDDYRDIGDQPLRLDCGHLEELLAEEDAYSRALSDSLFGLPDVGHFYDKVKLVIDRGAVPLHLRLLIDPRAPARFHSLRWETLRDPDDGRPIAKMRDVWLSRYLSSADWRPIMPRQQHELSALIAVANPDGLDGYAPGGTPLAPVEVEEELQRARDAFGRHPVTVLASRGEATLRNIIGQLKDGHRDVLYLICHGALLDGEPRLYLEKPDGAVAPTDGAELIAQLSELAERPMLVVLSACQSAGAGDEVSSRDDGALAALGPRLAQAGIPAVVAMQGRVTMATVAAFMPPFFAELLRSGVVDRAVAEARQAVGDRPDWWAPVLFTRLRTGRMWYAPGFGQEAGSTWDTILQRIKLNKCTPILGPGLADGLLGSRQEIASKWADTWQVPMAPNNREDLAKVTQYLAVYHDVQFPRLELVRYVRELLEDKYAQVLANPELTRAPYVREVLEKNYADEQLDGDQPKRELIHPPLDEMINTVGRLKRQDNPADPYRVMAELPFPMYITTSATSLLEEALIDTHQRPGVDWKPNVDFFDWDQPIDTGSGRRPDGLTPPAARTAPQAGDAQVRPLVYRLFGYIDDPESLVVTEDDHYAWLESWTANRRVSVLNEVTSALAGTTLLFLGFGLHDADFRVLFRAIKALKGSDRLRKWSHVAVQLNPESQLIEPEAAQEYIESYFGEDTIGKVSIYWERTEVFLEELHQRWLQGGRR